MTRVALKGRCFAVALALSLGLSTTAAQAQEPAQKALLDQYCVTCHSEKARTGGLSLEGANLADVPRGAETWEKVIRKLRVGAMPPQGMPRPDKTALDGLASYFETALDRGYSAKPNPGRATMHRLNRTEYANAIRDLLALDIDATALLPPDDESSGFDNIADVLRVSPSLMERYLSASWNISRLAVGNLSIAPTTATYRVRPDLSQDQHIDGLPLGTRGWHSGSPQLSGGWGVRRQSPAMAKYFRPAARHGRSASDRDQRGRRTSAPGYGGRPRRFRQDG
jgi:mono/diheme cytochrome c family protein